jgi:pilus assembly protein Flp/PilA
MKTWIMKFIRDEEGLTAVEYAVAGGLVSLAVVAAFTGLGEAIVARIGELIAAIS